MAIEMSNEQIIEEFDSLFAIDDDDSQGSEGNEEPDGEGNEPEGNEPEGNEDPDGEGSEGEGEGEGSEGTE